MNAIELGKYIVNRAINKSIEHNDENFKVHVSHLMKILYIIHKKTGVLEDEHFEYKYFGPYLQNVEKYFHNNVMKGLPRRIFIRQECSITPTLEIDDVIDKCLNRLDNIVEISKDNDKIKKLLKEKK